MENKEATKNSKEANSGESRKILSKTKIFLLDFDPCVCDAGKGIAGSRGYAHSSS